MPVTQAMGNTMKFEALKALLATGPFKIALYLQANSTFNQDSTAYSATGEVVGTGYTAGGQILTGGSVVVDHALNIAYLDFTDPTWPGSTLTADAAMIYRASDNVFMGCFTFTSITTVVGPTSCQLPPVGATALFKIA